jgi:ribosomal protein L11 methyltransferase
MPTTPASRIDLQVLTLTGPLRLLETCIGLLSPLCRGIREHAEGNKDGRSQLDIFIPEDGRPEVEAMLAAWQAVDLPAMEGVSTNWSPIPPEDWRIDWREHFSPIRVTAEIVIVPEWDCTTTAPVLIRIRPGMAFGTGHHASTRLVIRALARRGCRGQRVLDMGTGSGVLAIAAAFLGADQVLAVEDDPECAENFATNLELNGLTGKIPYVTADALSWDDFDFDLIMANINRTTVFSFMSQYANAGSRAALVMSGLVKEEEIQLQEHCRNLGLDVTNLSREEDWLCAEVMSSSAPG